MKEAPTVYLAADPRHVTLYRNNKRMEHDDWKARQALQAPAPRPIPRTTAEIVKRLNPAERHDVQQLLRRMTLRKTIRRVLFEHYHGLQPSGSMPPSQPAAPSASPKPWPQDGSNARHVVFEPHVIEDQVHRIQAP